MARNFVQASSQYMAASVSDPGFPVTIACWARFTAAGAATPRRLVTFSQAGALELRGIEIDGNNLVTAQEFSTAGGSTNGAARTVGSPTTGVWYPIIGAFLSSSSRIIWFGGEKVVNTDVSSAVGINLLTIGRREDANVQFMDGDLAEVGIWSIGFSDADAAAYLGGASPLLIHPEALTYYFPLMSPSTSEPSLMSTLTLTRTNSPVLAAHSPSFRAHTGRAGRFSTVALSLDKLGWRGDFPDIILDSAFEAVSSGFIPRPPVNPTDPTPT